MDGLEDLHVETNGAIELAPFIERIDSPLILYIMDYKLSGSKKQERMVTENIPLLRVRRTEFSIADDDDFEEVRCLEQHAIRATVLFSPVWETMPPDKLVRLMLERQLANVKLNIRVH